MARDNKPAANSVDAQIRNELDTLRAELKRLSSTTATFQQMRPTDVADPIEGQVIINWADSHRLYWYSGGEWHHNCDCPEGATGAIVLLGYIDGIVFQADIYVFPDATTIGPPTKITSVPHGVANEDYYRAMWEDDTRTTILAVYNKYDVSPDQMTIRRMGADGSNVQDVYTFAGNNAYSNAILQRTAAGPRAIFAQSSDDQLTARLVDLADGSLIDTISATDIVALGERFIFYRFNPAGTRVFAVITKAGTPNWQRGFTFDPDGSNVVGPITDDTNISGAFWHPDGTHFIYRPSNTTISEMDLDGSNKTVVYTSAGPTIPNFRFSPDGTMLALKEGANIKVLDAATYALEHTVPLPNDVSVNWDWGSTSDNFVIAEAIEITKVHILEFDGSFVTLYDSTEDITYLNSPNWSYKDIV
jgi:hypothetical protein